jgi:integrase
MQIIKQDKVDDYLTSVHVLSHSRATVATYRTGVTKFRRFLKSRYNCDENQIVLQIKNQPQTLFPILNEFIMYLDNDGKMPNSIRVWVSAVTGYLRHLGVKIYSEDLKHAVRAPKIIRRREEPLTKELLVRLLRNVSPKLQTAVLVAVASGMRIGEIVQLRIRDVDFDSKPTKIRIRAETTKTREERETFLTEEATKALKDYLKRFYGWSERKCSELQDQIIFGRTCLSGRKVRADSQPKNSYVHTGNLLRKILSSHIEKIPDLARRNENGRMIIHFHAFRKYCRTAVGNICGRDFAEDLIGHKFYLSTYYNPSEEQKRELYLKAEPYLTISDFVSIEKTLKDVSARQVELEKWKEGLTTYAREHGIEVPEFLFGKVSS